MQPLNGNKKNYINRKSYPSRKLLRNERVCDAGVGGTSDGQLVFEGLRPPGALRRTLRTSFIPITTRGSPEGGDEGTGAPTELIDTRLLRKLRAIVVNQAV